MPERARAGCAAGGDRLASELGKLKILTALDRAALAVYCGAYALWAEATEAIQKYGTMVKSPHGYPIQSPYVSIANRQAEIMMWIASEFDFTPASRSRISTPIKNEPNLFDGRVRLNAKTGPLWKRKMSVSGLIPIAERTFGEIAI
jgi:P27 family predicted phage terminase small subunit